MPGHVPGWVMPGFTAEQMDACGKHEYSPESCPVCKEDWDQEHAPRRQAVNWR